MPSPRLGAQPPHVWALQARDSGRACRSFSTPRGRTAPQLLSHLGHPCARFIARVESRPGSPRRWQTPFEWPTPSPPQATSRLCSSLPCLFRQACRPGHKGCASPPKSPGDRNHVTRLARHRRTESLDPCRSVDEQRLLPRWATHQPAPRAATPPALDSTRCARANSPNSREAPPPSRSAAAGATELDRLLGKIDLGHPPSASTSATPSRIRRVDSPGPRAEVLEKP